MIAIQMKYFDRFHNDKLKSKDKTLLNSKAALAIEAEILFLQRKDWSVKRGPQGHEACKADCPKGNARIIQMPRIILAIQK